MWDCWSSCGEEAGGGSRSFTEALREKYSSDNYPYCCPAVSAPWPVPDSPHREWLIVPPILGLSGCGVAWAGQQVGIKEFCNHVTELDISHNILNDWHEVSSIVRHIPQLDFLDLSGNSFGQSPITSVNFPQMLRRLVLNNTDADWTTVRTLLHSLPRLEELFLCFNNYKEVTLHPTLACSSSSASSSSTSSSSSSSNPTHSQSTLDSFHSWQSSVPSGSQSGGTQSLDTKHSKHTDGAGLEFQCTAALEHAGAQSANISDPNTSSPVHSDLLQNDHLVSDVSVQDPNTAICSFVNIKLLHITYNHLAAWDEICHLGLLFPCLERLVLANNPLQGISGCKEKLAKTFPRLRYLNLQNTALGEWSDIERLTALPALTDLRLLGIPLLKAHSATERRKLSIARLPCVRSLNGSWIFPEEREDAERFFLRHYMDTDPALLSPRQLGIRCPPAYRLLTPTICSHYAVPLCTAAKQESKSPTRPLSPHVTIFRWPLPMVMSIAHRATGVFLAAGMVGLGLSSVLPGDYASQLSALQTLGVSGFPIKFLLTVPLSYHTWNGIRHLAWDFGKGFKITEVFRSGYIVLAFTLLSSLGLSLI